MKTFLRLALLAILASTATAADKVPAHPHIKIDTTEGAIILELEGRRAPITVARILELIDSGFYDGTIFHRVIPGFMVQGGGFSPDLKPRKVPPMMPNESGNGMENVRGTIAMARTGDPHSASAQFFINVSDNTTLDPKPTGWGYTVFGYVIEGMDVVDKMVTVQTGPAGQFRSDVPVVPIVIKSIKRFEFGE